MAENSLSEHSGREQRTRSFLTAVHLLMRFEVVLATLAVDFRFLLGCAAPLSRFRFFSVSSGGSGGCTATPDQVGEGSMTSGCHRSRRKQALLGLRA